MVPPCYVSVEIGHQPIWSREPVGRLFCAEVPMIAFASLIVVPYDTLAVNHISQAVLERVRRRWHRLWNPPNHDFGKCIHSKHNTPADQRDGLHVGDANNTWRVLSTPPTAEPPNADHERRLRGGEATPKPSTSMALLGRVRGEAQVATLARARTLACASDEQ
jgi:hypothetical protein